MRLFWAALGTVIAVASFATLAERSASACGGCFHEPPPPQAPNETPSMITGHRMILSISSKQTTLYDQIKYTGNPKTFAWVLPISGTAEIGLSADIVFSTLGSMTENVVIAPPMNCPAPPTGSCDTQRGGFGGAEDNASTSAGSPSPSFDASAAPVPPPVTVTKEETVGPYETVQLHSTDPMALNDWLTTHGFTIPADVKPIIAKYVGEHFDFLAMKLVPGQGVQSMRPVRVTTAGAAPVLPLRMVAAGTGATVGITLWVIGEGRYEPQNFPFFQIGADELLWDWKTSSSNFNELRAKKTTDSAGRGWEVERPPTSRSRRSSRPSPTPTTRSTTPAPITRASPAVTAARTRSRPVKCARTTCRRSSKASRAPAHVSRVSARTCRARRSRSICRCKRPPIRARCRCSVW